MLDQFLLVRATEADEPHIRASIGENKAMWEAVDATERAKADFAIVSPSVAQNARGFVETPEIGKAEAMPAAVRLVLVRVEFESHGETLSVRLATA
jgi:hypothetical protein